MSIRNTIGRLTSVAAVCMAMAGFATSAHAVVIDGTPVGSIDELLCAGNLGNSGTAGEIAFIQSTGCANDPTLSIAFKDDIDSATLVENGLNAINVYPDEPGFFLLKFGGGPGDNTHFVFRNLIDLNFLVWSDAQLLAAGIGTSNTGNLLGISHYVYTNGGNQVPEPATLGLVGMAMLGLALSRRRKI